MLSLSYLMDTGKPGVFTIYHVSVQKDENTGVSIIMPEDTLTDLDFASIENMIDVLFV